MKTRLGLAVGHDGIRLVLIRAGAIVWAEMAEVDGPDVLAGRIAELLGKARRRRWSRPSVVVAVGPAFAQLRRVSGLPPLTDAGALARMVQTGAGRFFLRNGVPLLTTGIRLVEPGCVWAGAFDEPTIRAIVAGCQAARHRLRAVVPSVAVLGAALENDEVVWPDGPVAARVSLAEGRPTAVRKLATPGSDRAEERLRPQEPLVRIGEDAWQYADAYGAALLPPDEPLVLRPGKEIAGLRRVPRWRLAMAATALAAATATALLAPGLAASRAMRQAEARLGTLAELRQAAVLAERALSRFTGALGAVAEFDATRRSATLLLGELTRALPDGAAMVTLRVDTAGGTVVAVAPRAAQVVAALQRVPQITGAKIVGPVTRELIGTEDLERITVAFHFGEGAAAPEPSEEGSSSPTESNLGNAESAGSGAGVDRAAESRPGEDAADATAGDAEPRGSDAEESDGNETTERTTRPRRFRRGGGPPGRMGTRRGGRGQSR